MNIQGYAYTAPRSGAARPQHAAAPHFSGRPDDKKLSPEAEAQIGQAVDRFLTDRVTLPSSALGLLESLQKETGLEAERLLTLASTFVEPVRYFDFFTSPAKKAPPNAALVSAGQLEAMKDQYGYRLGNLSEEEVSAWMKANLKPLQPGTNAKTKWSDMLKSGKTFNFKDARHKDPAEKIYFALIGGLFTLGIGWVIQDRRVKKADNQRVLIGLDLLNQAVQARKQDPSLRLVTFMSGDDYDEKFNKNGKKVIYLNPVDLEAKP